MAKVTGIGGVFFKSDDPERLYAWYEEHLGLRRNPDGAVVLPWRHADDPEKTGMTVWSIFPRGTDYFGPTDRHSMVNYIVDDLDGMVEALRAAGAHVDDRREESQYGRFAWVTDPEGNRVELWEPPR
jgi:predicted enzyme related to lactoylglutathione lyase